MIKILLENNHVEHDLLGDDITQEVDSLGNPLTQEQVNFFRNSKVRDNKGNLLVCYHGTDSKFTTFEKGDIGFHFGTESAANIRREYKDNPETWYVDKYYLNIKNYIDTYDFGDWDGMTVARHLVESRLISLNDEEIKMLQVLGSSGGYYDDSTTKQVRDFLISKGIDGFRYENAYEDEGSMSYIAFNPNQIKSITNTNPTNSNNINEDVSSTILYRGKGMNNNPTNEYSGGRFYADTIDDASNYGDLIQVVELLPNAKIFSYSNSYDYCDNNGLLDNEYDIIYKLTNQFHTLRDAYEELVWNGENPNLYYQVSQYIISQELSKQGYDGAEWKYEDDLISHQYQIWNDKVIKHIKNVDVNGSELKENMDITNEVHYAVDNIMNNKDRYPNQDSLEDAIYSAVANVFSGLYGVTRDTADMIADVYEKELKRVGLNSINEEFVNELVPGELYHFIHNTKILYGTFKKKTPAWLFFDVEGKEVLAKPWTSVATTTEELEELIGLVDKMEKDTKIPSQVPNRFTRVPNQHGKPMGESNELEQRAKKHKKKSKGMGWHMSMNAGDVEKGTEVFNHMQPSGSPSVSPANGTAMGEGLEYRTYQYEGPIYYRGSKIATRSNIFTSAPSQEVAIRNILYRAANGDSELYQYDIVDHMVKEVEGSNPVAYPALDKEEKCSNCGYRLNIAGECPVCDYGESDLLEDISNLDVIRQLNNMNI